MSDLITYDDKVRLKSQNVSEKYKVTAGDMNEIKSVVNTNVELVDEINKPENWVSVGTTAPTDGRRVWFKKSKNLFVGYNNMLSGFLPQNGSYPITNTSFPNAKYMLINLKEGESITTSGITSNTNGRVRFIDEITNQVVGSIDQGSSSYYETTASYGDGFKNGTITAKKNFVVGIMMTNNNTTGLDNFQIEYGTTATSYEPYNRAINVDDEQWLNKTNLVSVGATSPTGGERVWFGKSKNLLPTNQYISTRTTNGITFTNNGDGTFNVSGTATANTTMVILPENNFQLEQGQAYYLYCSVPYHASTFNISIAMTDNGSLKYILGNNTYTPTAQPTQERVAFYVPNGTSVSATNVKLMLVKGNTAPSEYEPYVDEGIYVDEELYSKPKVLWNNPSPANNFASQLITLADNLSNYKYYEVIYRHHKTLDIYSSTGKVLSSDHALLMSSRFINATREVTAIGTGTITFGHSTDFLTYGSTTATNNNDRNIPIQILGYK